MHLCWTIELDEAVETQMHTDFKSGKITLEDIVVIQKWHDDMIEYGPERLIQMGKYDDHHLDGDWSGFRTACFSPSGRIIYRVVENKVLISVVRADHDYGR